MTVTAGNSNQNTDTTPQSPSGLPNANILAVAVTDANDNRASLSNYGIISVDVGAPGVSIYSTYHVIRELYLDVRNVYGNPRTLRAWLPS